MGNRIAARIRSFFTENLGLKLMSLVCALLLWLLVVNVDDPTQSRNFTATVSVKHENVLTDAGKYYELPSGNTVTFRVTARRSIIEDLSSSDFAVTADMRYLEDDVRVPVEIAAKRHKSQVSISSKTHYLTVSVGDQSETTFMVKAKTTGTPANGFAVGNIEVTPDVISVEGPVEVVSKIDTVAVTCDVDGQSADVSATAAPKLYDENGAEIDMTELTLSADSVDITVDLVSVQEVKLSVETRGELQEGLELDEITTDPESIRLQGDSEKLNSLTTLVIPSSVINLSEVTEDFSTTIDITSYLPDGISLAEGEDSQVQIKISVLTTTSKTFKVNTNNLTVRNLGEGLEAAFTRKNISVTVTALPSELAELKSSAIVGSVDASGLSAGTHTVAVVLDLDEAYHTGIVTAVIKLSASETESDGDADTDGEQDGDTGDGTDEAGEAEQEDAL